MCREIVGGRYVVAIEGLWIFFPVQWLRAVPCVCGRDKKAVLGARYLIRLVYLSYLSIGPYLIGLHYNAMTSHQLHLFTQ